jgi:hypothetical protein
MKIIIKQIAIYNIASVLLDLGFSLILFFFPQSTGKTQFRGFIRRFSIFIRSSKISHI